MMKRLLSAISVLLLFYSCQSQEITSNNIVIKNVNIVDVVAGKVIPGKDVLIEGATISSIVDPLSNYDSTTAIDGSGKYLIPGLWDMHTHYNWNYKYASPLLVANGITGIREMWGDMNTINNIRKRTESGKLVAPDIYTAGVIIDGDPPVWDGSVGVANAEEAINEVNKQYETGVDFFKVYSLLSRESYYAIAKRSKELNVPFAGHVPNSISIWEAVEVGQQSIEHLYGLLEGCSSNSKNLSNYEGTEYSNMLVDGFDKDKFDSLVVVLAQSESWLSPTLTVLNSISNLDDTTLINDPRLEYMPESVRSWWDPDNDFRFKNAKEGYYEAGRRKFKLQQSLMGDFEEAGVKIIAGTDYPNPYCFPGFSLHDELQLMVEGGMSTAGALRTATYNPALFMAKAQTLGSISDGKLANLVLLNGNPLENIGNTREIEAVILRGKYFNRSDLEALLEEAKEAAANE